MSVCVVRKCGACISKPPGRLLALNGRYFRTYEYGDGVVTICETDESGGREGRWIVWGNMHNLDGALEMLEERCVQESDRG